jgi:adenine phosphoribosyltransferase
MKVADLQALVRAIPDFPKPGIMFRDITPLIKDARGFATAINMLADAYRGQKIDYVVAIEARGYLVGAPLAHTLGSGLIPVRKPGKLPYDTLKADYALEYGTNTLEVHRDALSHGERVLIADDLLATGGTAGATKNLVEQLGGHVVGFAFLIELTELNGRRRLGDTPVTTLMNF